MVNGGKTLRLQMKSSDRGDAENVYVTCSVSLPGQICVIFPFLLMYYRTD